MKQKLYIKNEKGRYVPYVEPSAPKENLVRYAKVGNKYEPVSMCMESELDEGVYAVVKHRYGESRISVKYAYECYKIADLKKIDFATLGYAEKLTNYLCDHLDELNVAASKYEYCRAIVGMMLQFNDSEEK